ncbi:MAG: hypothetical protein O7J95_17815 [Planctomycetota bacterium]|nr:hypothetical protein [Planctomycetota bacterium]
MSKVLNDAFRGDARRFFDKYSVAPPNAVRIFAPEKTGFVYSSVFGKGTDIKYGVKHASMKEGKGVYWLDFFSDPDLKIAGKTRLTFRTYKTNTEDALARAHFLPWRSSFIVEYKIPELADKDTDETNPPYFFTSALSGCSVFARGSPESPTVSHGGRELPLPSETSWRALLDLYLHGSVRRNQIFGVNKSRYMVHKAGKSWQTSDYKKTKSTFTKKESWTVKRRSSWACVFGIRSDGRWSFFLQRNTLVAVFNVSRKKSWGKTTETETMDSASSYDVPEKVSRFFPAGPAVVNPKMEAEVS